MNPKYDFIFYSTGDWDEPYWTNKQHTASHLAALGHKVLYIESVGLRAPKLHSGRDISRIARRVKQAISGLRNVEENIWVYSPLVIPFKHHWPLVRLFNQGVLRTAVKYFIGRLGFKESIIWTYHPFMLQTMPGRDWSHLIYHCVDDLSVIPGIDLSTYQREERRLLDKADVVFTTSQVLLERCQPFNDNTHYFPNVADLEHFSTAHQLKNLPPDIRDVSRPILGYIGVLSDFKLDFPLVYEVARLRPQWQWVFIGEEREGQSNDTVKGLKQLPNVHFIGRKGYDTLPAYMAAMSVGTLPTLINDYTHAMFPMKYFEYLSAGLPVVSTALGFTKSFSTGLQVVDDANSFIEAIESSLARGKYSYNESVAMVADNTWSARLTKMLGIIDKQQ